MAATQESTGPRPMARVPALLLLLLAAVAAPARGTPENRAGEKSAQTTEWLLSPTPQTLELQRGKVTARWYDASGDSFAPKNPIDPNRLHHIFGQPRHKLGPVLNQFGGDQQAAFRAVQNAAQAAVRQQGINGVFNNLVVNVGGVNVTVRGIVINGVVRIGTFFIP